MKDSSGAVQGTFRRHFRLVTEVLSRVAVVVSLPEYSWACSPPKKMRLTRTNGEWVPQVSLLRPGFLHANGS
jgi:hypothetical protein